MQEKRVVLNYEEDTNTAQECVSNKNNTITLHSSSTHESAKTVMTMISSDGQGQHNVIMSNHSPSRGSNYNRSNHNFRNDNSNISNNNASIITSLQSSTAQAAESMPTRLVSYSSSKNHASTNHFNGINCNAEDINRKNGEGRKNSCREAGSITSGGGGRVGGRSINSDEVTTSHESVEKPQSRKTPFYYCKALGWDPTLSKFHIHLDMDYVRVCKKKCNCMRYITLVN